MSKKESKSDFDRKASLALWQHQNELFWRRFPWMYVIQGGFLTVVSYNNIDCLLAWTALVLTVLLTIWIFLLANKDEQLRDHHGNILKRRFGFDPLPDQVMKPRFVSPRFVHVAFRASVVIFILMDIYAAWFITKSKSDVCIDGAYLLAFLRNHFGP